MNRLSTLVCLGIVGLVVSVSMDANANCNSVGYCDAQDNSGTGPSFTGTCDSAQGCIQGGNSGTGAAISVINAGTGTGIYSETSGYAVDAVSTSNDGIYAQTSANTIGVAAGYFYTSAGANSTAVAGDNESAGTGVYGKSVGGYAGYFDGDVNVTGCIEWNGTKEFGCTSDQRLKRDIAPVANALDTLLKLKGVTYYWKSPETQGKGGAEIQTGFIAQDVEKVFPQWVGENPGGFKALAIPPVHIAALEVESIRTLKAENDDLRTRTAKLEERLKAIEVGRRPMMSGLGLDGAGLGVAGLALAAAFVVRRKRDQELKPSS